MEEKLEKPTRSWKTVRPPPHHSACVVSLQSWLQAQAKNRQVIQEPLRGQLSPTITGAGQDLGEGAHYLHELTDGPAPRPGCLTVKQLEESDD